MIALNRAGARREWTGENEVRVTSPRSPRTSSTRRWHAESARRFLLAGPLLARARPRDRAAAGRRRDRPTPLDPHIHAFAELGAEIDIGGRYELQTDGLRGKHIFLDEASVMATENASWPPSLTRARP
jgi:UDP-N-acetylglucosamine enolpyruvyl transferase